jgi:hypothetical protein
MNKKSIVKAALVKDGIRIFNDLDNYAAKNSP